MPVKSLQQVRTAGGAKPKDNAITWNSSVLFVGADVFSFVEPAGFERGAVFGGPAAVARSQRGVEVIDCLSND